MHLAMVVDEYGIIQGLVTLSDIFGTIAGDLPPSQPGPDPSAFYREDGAWLIDGLLPIEKFREIFHLTNPSDEDEGRYHTIAGFVISHLNRIPVRRSIMKYSGFSFEVLDMDGKRIDKLLVTPPQNP